MVSHKLCTWIKEANFLGWNFARWEKFCQLSCLLGLGSVQRWFKVVSQQLLGWGVGSLGRPAPFPSSYMVSRKDKRINNITMDCECSQPQKSNVSSGYHGPVKIEQLKGVGLLGNFSWEWRKRGGLKTGGVLRIFSTIIFSVKLQFGTHFKFIELLPYLKTKNKGKILIFTPSQI